ncbi:MAG: hypothetical protein B6245_02515 [Desulfobacteraceae bacterium 4572_88]|nr:MAG: hypothetical protein B6245_02515 [Desulfobacteraceae bacterium 4572_88]
MDGIKDMAKGSQAENNYKIFIFDWGDTLMRVFPGEKGPMCQWPEVEAVGDAPEVLKKLSKCADCYLATNAKDSAKADIRRALKRVGMDARIKDIFCYRDMGCEKSSKAYFKEMMRRLQAEKHEIILIGDSPEKDVRWAIENGIAGILLDPENRHPNCQYPKIRSLLEIVPGEAKQMT